MLHAVHANPLQCVAICFPQNYNKSRIHSYRGAKDIEIHLDEALIFKGEIARACGEIIGSSDAFGDVSFIFILEKHHCI